IRPNRLAVVPGERLYHLPVLVQHLRPQFASNVRVHEQVLAAELHRPCRQRAPRRAGIHRGEAVPAEQRQARATDARVWRTLLPRPPAAVEAQLLADDQATAAGRLDVAPVPVTVILRHADEGSVVRPIPVEAVAAEAVADLVRLGPVLRLASPDAKQAEQYAL